jgi:Pirin-related protein
MFQFFYLPVKESSRMKTILHSANMRGNAQHGWLSTYHSFSFADYYNPDMMGFGMLRVLNDDTIQPGQGFGLHPHQNMEIVTIPLHGKLEHKDNTGGGGVIALGEIQVMSAGTGVYHSEFNASQMEPVSLLQIWVMPEKQDLSPRYDQQRFDDTLFHNSIYRVVAPKGTEGLWINQQTWFSLARFDAGEGDTYRFSSQGSGVYCFVIEGKVVVADNVLNRRDALGIWKATQFEVVAKTNAFLLFIEVPMM